MISLTTLTKSEYYLMIWTFTLSWPEGSRHMFHKFVFLSHKQQILTAVRESFKFNISRSTLCNHILMRNKSYSGEFLHFQQVLTYSKHFLELSIIYNQFQALFTILKNSHINELTLNCQIRTPDSLCIHLWSENRSRAASFLRDWMEYGGMKKVDGVGMKRRNYGIWNRKICIIEQG